MDPDMAHCGSPERDSNPQAAAAPRMAGTTPHRRQSACEGYKRACGPSATRELSDGVVVDRIWSWCG